MWSALSSTRNQKHKKKKLKHTNASAHLILFKSNWTAFTDIGLSCPIKISEGSPNGSRKTSKSENQTRVVELSKV